jgi:Ni/Fe-hydrogenase subunit HybB-like protein
MVHESLAATHAVVTLDVGLPGIVWGWIIVMNMWAKSIGTGVIFMLFYLIKKYPNEAGYLRFPLTVVSIVTIHIFFHPHWTSAITIGSFLATAFVGMIFLLAYLSFIKKDNAAFDKVLTWTTILAVPVTLYTAALMAQSTARELWQMPTEAAQMILAATLAGSATTLLMGGKLPYEAKRDLAVILGLSAFAAFVLYMSELVFGPMKAEEVAATLEFIKGHGEFTTWFWIGQVFAFIVPMVLVTLSVQNKSTGLLTLASVSAIAGLWVVKWVWLVIPQLLSMS